jgi:DNA adenine methylase
MLPAHETYVEPFAGSAAVLFAKAPAPVEVINDADPEIADAYRLIQKLSPADLGRLRTMPWLGDQKTFLKVFESKPTDSVSRLYRFLYVSHFSYGKKRGKSFSPSALGVTATTPDRVERFAPRLRRVRIYDGDYEAVVRKYDAPSTVHFLDPPYPGYDVGVGEASFDEQRFFDTAKSLKGKFLVTYGVRGRFPKLVKQTDWWTRRIRTRRAIANMRGAKDTSVLTQLLVANYEPTAKSCEGIEFADWQAGPEDSFEKPSRLVKGVDPSDERYVLGIVLEPEVVDAQGDIYSAEEIRSAAHCFMEDFGGLGLMHRLKVNGQVKVLESFLAPTDFTAGGVEVRKGTWLLAVRVVSDALWEQVKAGDLTGFSIGGTARRCPEGSVIPSGADSPSEAA